MCIETLLSKAACFAGPCNLPFDECVRVLIESSHPSYDAATVRMHACGFEWVCPGGVCCCCSRLDCGVAHPISLLFVQVAPPRALASGFCMFVVCGCLFVESSSLQDDTHVHLHWSFSGSGVLSGVLLKTQDCQVPRPAFAGVRLWRCCWLLPFPGSQPFRMHVRAHLSKVRCQHGLCMCCMAAVLPRAVLAYQAVCVVAVSTRPAGFQMARCPCRASRTHASPTHMAGIILCCMMMQPYCSTGGHHLGLLSIPLVFAGLCWPYAWLLPLLVCRCSSRMLLPPAARLSHGCACHASTQLYLFCLLH